MRKNKNVLFEELKKIQEADEKLYVGSIDKIRKSSYDTDDLYFAYLVHLVNEPDANFKQSDFKYLFERIQYADMIVYREVFSGATLERIDLKKVLSSRGMYVVDPISYDDYVSNISVSHEDKNVQSDGILKRVKVQK